MKQKMNRKSFLANTHPHLRDEFLYCLDKAGNQDNVNTFNTLATNSDRYVMWKCPKTNCETNCAHVYKATVKNRTKNASNCPYCVGQKTCICNSFMSKCPELVLEWGENGLLTPNQITPRSGKKIQWKCRQAKCDHHIWVDTPHNRNDPTTPRGCPFCSGHQFCACYCLATEFSDIIENEWDYEKNMHLNVWKLGPYSEKRAFWICVKCKFEWNTRISTRTLNKSGCPKCSQSKTEQQMHNLLQQMQKSKCITSLISQWRLETTRLTADFLVCVGKNKIVIEMDGEQHFRPVNFGSKSRTKEEMFAQVQRNDLRKKEWCEANGVRLLRISYLVKPEDYEAEVLDFIAAKHVEYRMVGVPETK